MPGQCGLIGGPAADVAKQGLSTVQSYADGAILRSSQASDALKDFMQTLTPISADIDLEDAGRLSSPFSPGDKPNRPDFSITIPDVDYEPSINDVAFVKTVLHPGDFTGRAPALDFGVKPEPVTQDAPGAAPTITDRDFPVAPDATIPALPSFREIVVPGLPVLTLPEFTSAAPDDLQISDIPAFSWTEDERVPEVMAESVAQIKAILGGSTGIPDAIWDMIWARARRQTNRALRQAVEQISERYSAMGHMVPNGSQRKRTRDAEDMSLDQTGEASRAMAIQDSQIYVDRLNFALAQGIALEGQLMNLHSQQASRALQAEQLVITLAIQSMSLKVTAYNARMSAYAQEAQVFVSIMQGELARLESYKAALEGQKLVSQINLQDLEAYRARVSAIESTFSLYSEQIKAVLGQVEVDKIRVEAFGEEVRAFEAIHKGKEAEYRAYSSSIQAELGRLEPYKLESDVYLNRLQSYKIGVDSDRAVAETQIASERLKLERLNSSLESVKLSVDAESTRVNALSQAYTGDARIFSAAGEVERSRVTSDGQRLEVLINNARIKADNQLKNIELNMRHAEQLTSQQLSGYSGILQANTQIGASSISSLNFSASISDGVSNSTGCTTSYSE